MLLPSHLTKLQNNTKNDQTFSSNLNVSQKKKNLKNIYRKAKILNTQLDKIQEFCPSVKDYRTQKEKRNYNPLTRRKINQN